MTQKLILAAMGLLLTSFQTYAETEQPNILWIVSEDHGPHVGCYGDSFATTPNIDQLAARGIRYTHCWSNAPVCAPARSTLISGMYPPSTGSEHMRSMVPYPKGKSMFPVLLRQAGYYCTNNLKEDYNLSQVGEVWDESSNRAHWRKRPEGKPFFAVFNSSQSHESQIRKRPHEAVHDPAKVRVPTYHPDDPDVRRDWAQYYDQVTKADADAGARLDELTADGLWESTIIFYYADHGSGMPRNKRSVCKSGLHVPLVVYIPEKFASLRPEGYREGGENGRLVSFVDFAPTVLSLAGVEPPAWMQGSAFLGPYTTEAPKYMFGFRGRMDERMDMVRGATDGRFVYVRNFHPHRPHGQYQSYMFQTPTTRAWYSLHVQGKLTEAQDRYWQPKEAEELYDLSTDPDEVVNLAGASEHEQDLERLRGALDGWIRRIRDVGFLPEGEMFARSEGRAPYDSLADDAVYPFERVYAAASDASMPGIPVEKILAHCEDPDSAVRYWGMMGLLIRGAQGYAAGKSALLIGLDDSSPYVRIVAAEELARHGDDAERARADAVLVEAGDWGRNNVWVSVSALNAMDALGAPGQKLKDEVRARKSRGKVPHPRYADYVPRLLADHGKR